ncbi:MAG TPA: hypothetical protein VGE97_02825 [Nitrososphaera sp.]
MLTAFASIKQTAQVLRLVLYPAWERLAYAAADPPVCCMSQGGTKGGRGRQAAENCPLRFADRNYQGTGQSYVSYLHSPCLFLND